jgi:hypothetical protein
MKALQKLLSKLKPVATPIIAVTLAAGLLLGGTFAWTDYKQHKTNELGAGQLGYDVRLIEAFKPNANWKLGEAQTKVIRVTNKGASSDYENVYVRLALKEYMEIVPFGVVETAERFAVGTDGEYLVFDQLGSQLTDEHVYDPTTGKWHIPNVSWFTPPDYSNEASDWSEWLNDNDYPTTNSADRLVYLKDMVTGDEGYFIKTENGDINGQFGKFVAVGLTDATAAPVIPNTVRAVVSADAEVWHQLGTTAECEYPVHGWVDEQSNTDLIRAYVEWTLGDEVIALSEWDGDTVAKWIYDDTADYKNFNPETPYVYWGEPLAPGETTPELLKSVKLIQQPDGAFYYAIHTDMEAVSLNELAVEWSDAPDSSKDAFAVPPSGMKIESALDLRRAVAIGGEYYLARNITLDGTSLTDEFSKQTSQNLFVGIDSAFEKLILHGNGKTVEYKPTAGIDQTYAFSVWDVEGTATEPKTIAIDNLTVIAGTPMEIHRCEYLDVTISDCVLDGTLGDARFVLRDAVNCTLTVDNSTLYHPSTNVDGLGQGWIILTGGSKNNKVNIGENGNVIFISRSSSVGGTFDYRVAPGNLQLVKNEGIGNYVKIWHDEALYYSANT